jgi:hypothetical protein
LAAYAGCRLSAACAATSFGATTLRNNTCSWSLAYNPENQADLRWSMRSPVIVHLLHAVLLPSVEGRRIYTPLFLLCWVLPACAMHLTMRQEQPQNICVKEDQRTSCGVASCTLSDTAAFSAPCHRVDATASEHAIVVNQSVLCWIAPESGC